MRFGLLISNVGTYAEPKATLELAHAAEEAGWEALLVWDHLAFVWGPPASDPWITVAAVGAATTHLLVGTGVTPVARRRPHVLAHEIATLDRLTGGRTIFGAGLGGGRGEFARFGEDEGEHARAARLDEGLEVIRALLDGGVVDHRGPHFTVDGVQLKPPPVRHVPIWIGGMSARARQRAERYDGWFANTAGRDEIITTPREFAAMLAGYRFADVAFMGYSDPGERELQNAYAAAGATWWIEQIHDARGDHESMLARVTAGP